MANNEQLTVLLQGSEAWNKWTTENPDKMATLIGADLYAADLHGADLHGANLSRADLRGADLHGANLSMADLYGADLYGANLNLATLIKATLIEANLIKADFIVADLSRSDLSRSNLIRADLHGANLSRANLSEADLSEADLSEADLSGADLHGADLHGADLSRADLSGANLSGADLREAGLIETNLERAILTGCKVYGISAWNLKLDGSEQNNLIITKSDEPAISADNLEVAQFIYLLLHNENIRHVIDTITSKVVLIIGRFTPERKAVLDFIKGELRRRDYLPVLFDFEGPRTQDITETVSTLAHMARFVIADITDAKSIPAELEHIVPQLPSVAVQPLINKSDEEYGLFNHIQRYPWVLPLYRYENQDELLAALEEKVISPAEAKANEIRNI
jgi:uncharacterized protein YjbI with pentapeptide repeats